MSDLTKGFVSVAAVVLLVVLLAGEIRAAGVLFSFMAISFCIFILPASSGSYAIWEQSSRELRSVEEHHYHYYEAPRGISAAEAEVRWVDGTSARLRRIDRFE